MTIISQDDFITSVADALQYISYYHPVDFIQAMKRAYEKEESPAAKDAIAQILVNSRLCAIGKRPICQDTGIVTVFLNIGMDVSWQADMGVEDMVNEGVRRAYLLPENILRPSIVSDPAGKRQNTGDNTPAVIHTRVVPGDRVEVIVAAKGGGSENKAKFAVLNPSDSIVDWVVETVSNLGAGWCPPGIISIGIGGTAEKAMLLAKHAMMAPVDMPDLIEKGPSTTLEALRLEIYEKINALGIGAQGLGGLVTALDIKIEDYPTHAASKPVALIPNCAATRHAHFFLDGSGPAQLTPPDINDWPDIAWDPSHSRRINLQEVTHADIQTWKPGETLLLNGFLLTGRDAAHKKVAELIENNQPLPPGLDFTGRFIYYVGPVDPVGDEVMGPAGPTTATRMDKFTEMMLAKTGLAGMIGKAERGPAGIEAIRKHQSVYLIATGGAAYLVSRAIRSARVVAFEELGMEAVYEFEVKDMPVTVAVSSQGESVHETAPRYWRERIGQVVVPFHER